jgi:uncharacterized membrane protein
MCFQVLQASVFTPGVKICSATAVGVGDLLTNFFFFSLLYVLSVTNENLIYQEIKRRLNSCDVCYHSVQNLLSFRLLFITVKIRICKL